MSNPSPFSGGPFDELLRSLAKLFTTQGPVNWDIARQIAQWTATGGENEANPDPLARIRIDELLRVAEMHVGEASGLSTSTRGWLGAKCVNRSEWASAMLETWRPLLERLATAMSAPTSSPEMPTELANLLGGADQMANLIGNLPQVLGPLLFGVQAGTAIGQLATSAMGQYDLPLPAPPTDDLLFVPTAIDAFAKDWSLPEDDVRMWVCLREVVNHAVLSRPHVRKRLEDLLLSYVGGFKADTSTFQSHLENFDPTDMAGLQQAFGDPEALLSQMQTEEQRQLLVPLTALLSVVIGYTDYLMDSVGRRLVSSYPLLTEALRRRRLEDNPGKRILGTLLGIELDERTVDRGQSFVKGILERAGDQALVRLWASERELPTPAEVDAPGLWLARIDLPD